MNDIASLMDRISEEIIITWILVNWINVFGHTGIPEN